MEVGKIRRRIMAMFLVVLVITAAVQTTYLEAADGPYASNPDPADGEMIRGKEYLPSGNIYTTLDASPGLNAVSHVAYFSHIYDEVAGRVEDANIGPQLLSVPNLRWIIGLPDDVHPGDPYPDGLVRGTTYYWCVDETDGNNVVWEGPVWSFYIRDYKASVPNPPDGAVVLGPDVLLSWVPGIEVQEHDVYFGTDFNDVNGASGPLEPFPPPEYLGTVEEPSIWVTGLSENTWYYWRVDEVSGRYMPGTGTIYKGDVWSFKTAGLVAHWKLDEGTGSVAYDSAGNNDGTIYGAAWASGIIDGALDFDGEDDYVGVPDDDSVDFVSGVNFSVSVWVRSFSTKPENILQKFRSIENAGYAVRISTLGAYFQTHNYNDVGEITASHAGQYNDGTWHHFAGVRNQTAGKIYLYVDGLEVGSADEQERSLSNSANLLFGVDYRMDRGFFTGSIDDVRIYDRALSAAEIEELYNSVPPVGQTYHVDGVNGDNTNDGLTRETAFKTIQRGINVAGDFDTVLVWPGVYNEEVAFWGDAITVKSAADAAIIETDYGYAFSFFSAEGHDTVLSNFVIRNSQYGIYLINGSSPTLRNLTIVNNDFGISAFNGADPDISSCIFWNNYYGHLFREPVPLQAKYSFVQEEVSEPIAHWKFDDGSGSTATDSAGTNHGTLIGDPTWTAGRIGGALSFDGDGDYVEFASVAALEGDNLTALAWVRVDESAGVWNPVMMQHDLNSNGYSFYIANNRPAFYLLAGPSYVQAISPETINAEQWYHIAGTNDGSNLKLYVDGQLKDSEASTGFTGVNYNAYVGLEPTSMLYYKGLIDDVRIYDRALSAGGIKAIYGDNLAGLSYSEPGFVDANGGDYHLLSERGRYWPAHDVWVLDDVTSPCIDGGDPAVDPSNERMPNGGRINMGAYGNTAYASMSECWSKSDFNCDGIVNFRDFAVFVQDWLETALVVPEPNVPDVTPPAPVPVIITIGAVSSSSIRMTASEAFDESGVEYYFEALTAGGHDSGWIGARTYTDAGLIPDTTYCYRVKARDKSANYNETIWSPQVCAVTVVLPDTLAPLPDPMQWDDVIDANGFNGLPREILLPPYGAFDYGATMRAIDADDQAPVGVAPAEVEYYFDCIDDSGFNSGWRTVADYPNEDDRRTYTVKVGNAGQALRFRVRARDASDNLNKTDWSIIYPAITP